MVSNSYETPPDLDRQSSPDEFHSSSFDYTNNGLNFDHYFQQTVDETPVQDEFFYTDSFRVMRNSVSYNGVYPLVHSRTNSENGSPVLQDNNNLDKIPSLEGFELASYTPITITITIIIHLLTASIMIML